MNLRHNFYALDGFGWKRAIVLLFLTAVSSSYFEGAHAEPHLGECAGVLHRDQDGVRIGGGWGEDEGICVINKSDERKVLAVCGLEKFCRVRGLIDDCKDSGECSELTKIYSIWKK